MNKFSVTYLLYKVTLALTFALLPSLLDAQEQRKFQYIGTQDGLPDGKITCLTTDHQGALWIGTDAGLARYDGYTVGTVADCAVSEVYEDAAGDIWVCSGEMFVRYLRREHRLNTETEAFFASMGIEGQKRFVYAGRSRLLWVATASSLHCYDAASRSLRTVAAAPAAWRDMESHSVADSDDALYVCDLRGGLWRIDKLNGSVATLPFPGGLKGRRPRLYADRSGTLWIYSTLCERIYRMAADGRWQAVELNAGCPTATAATANAIHQIADDGRGTVWIATDHRGLFGYDTASGTVTHHITAGGEWGDMAENNVNALTADSHGTLWLGHYKRGISYSGADFGMFSLTARECGDVSSLLADRSGRLWIGTDGGGLFRADTAGGPAVRTPLRDMVVAGMLQDRAGRVWAGTYNSGLWCIAPDGSMTEWSAARGNLPTDMSWRIAEDAAGQIWVCSSFHPLLRLDPATGKYTYMKTSDGGDVYGLSMAQDRRGRLFVGTSYGLYIADTATGGSSTAFGNRSGSRQFLDQQVMALFYDSRDILWMGHNRGLAAWDMQTDSLWFFTTAGRGLCNNIVKSIQEDRDGNIWVSTAGGISRISVTDRTRGEFQVLNYKHIAGASNNYFNLNASALLPDGTVLFGCVSGCVATHPQLHRRTERHPPQVFFSSVTAGGRPLDTGAGSISLDHSDHSIIFSLMTDNPANASEVHYAYSITGGDDWVQTASPVISFASLSAGTYTLRVKACDGDGLWSDERTLRVSVAPPLWLSPLMLCLYLVCAAAAALWLLLRSRRRTAQKMRMERRRMEQDKNVRVAEMKLRFFTNVSHDLRTPLTLIISPLQTLLREQLPAGVVRRLQIMEKNAMLLQEQISMLLDFRRLDVGAERLHLQVADVVAFVRGECDTFATYAADRGITFGFSSDTETLRMEFDHDKIHKIIYNLLSNAFKYTPDGRSIAVSLRRLPQEIELSVADSGPGVADGDKQLVFERFYQSQAAGGTDANAAQHLTGSGIGLHIVSEYVRLMGGTVRVDDAPGGGAVFTCRIPAAAVPGTNAEAAPEGHDAPADAFTVLVVDDNQDMCEFISTSLADKYHVLTAANGAEALKELGRETVSLVVSDVMMPVMDGLELCRRIKSDLQLSHIPVILLTARTAESSVMEGYETGADDYLTKPFNIDMLRLRIGKFIELSKAAHRLFHQKMDVQPAEITITPLDEQFMKRAMEAVERHIGDSGFSVETLGQELAMNRVALWKKLQAITGRGPADFIRTIRVKRGRQLLDEGQKNVSEVAYLVGYNTVKRFTENFKAEFGMTPSEYRKSREAKQ